MDNFNLKKFLVENKITQNSKLFEADDFEFTDLDRKLADQLSGLTIGDTITPDMWNKQKIEAMNTHDFRIIYDEIIQDSYFIKDMDFDEGDDEAGAEWLVQLQDKNNYSWGITGTPEELSFLNSILKDKYQIISPEPKG
jgi:hypothetical protein